MYSTRDDWDSQNKQIVLEGTQILERTGESIARSHQIAIETEDIGTEVISDLGQQREALLRTRDRLSDANTQLDNVKLLLKKMGHNVVYNKAILVLIIILEAVILIFLTYMKFSKK